MFFRIFKIVHSSRLLSNRTLYTRSNHLLVCAGSPKIYANQIIRHYSKKDEVKDICKSSRKPVLVACKPKPIKPCLPCPPTPSTDPCDPKVKREDIANATNLDCQWADVDAKWSQKLKKYVILGAIIAAAAIGALVYYAQDQEVKKQPVKKKRVFVRPKPECKCPTYSKEFPKHVPYLLVGGGTASFAAFRAIKSSDPHAKVLVVSNECDFPYMRPPLSKEMWFTDNNLAAHKLIFKQWNGTERSLFYEPKDFYIPVTELLNQTNGGVAVARGWTIQRIDVVNKKAYLEDGTEIGYDKCLVATGSTPKNLPIFENAKPRIKEKISIFREIFDFQELTEICNDAYEVAVIGGGFLGSELACAIGKISKSTKNRVKVFQIYREKGNMAHILPEYLSDWTTEKVREEGVQIVANTEVEDVSISDKCQLTLHLNTGRKIDVDHVVVAIGVKPNTQLAETSDLETDPELGGYLVNTEMEARSNLYVAGDCSCFYDTKLGRRRVEHHDHAVVSGRLAGENMTGASKPYLHQSMFWSDLGPNVGFEAIGIIDSSLPTVGVFAKPSEDETKDDAKENQTPNKTDKHKHDSTNDEFNKGVIFYLKDETVVGIVLWNIFNRMSVARQVLKDQKKYDDLNEVAKLFNIHDTEVNVEAAAE